MSPGSKSVADTPLTLVLLANCSKLEIPTTWRQVMGAAIEYILLETGHSGLGAVSLVVADADSFTVFISKLYSLLDAVELIKVTQLFIQSKKSTGYFKYRWILIYVRNQFGCIAFNASFFL